MGALLVEVDDFVGASRAMHGEVADVLAGAVIRLEGGLLRVGPMAGSDPGGVAWASEYDPAALAAVNAMHQLTNGAYRLSAMFAVSGRNYQAADLASTATARRRIDPLTATLPDEMVLGAASLGLPSAAGGPGDTPSGWGLISHLVGCVWPNGHQDRLRAAAAAWTASADALVTCVQPAWNVSLSFLQDQVPEWLDIQRVCLGLSDHLQDLANSQRTLARACTALAEHIDQVHAAAIGELTSLLEWSAGIQVVGGFVGVITLGAAEVPTQGVQLAKATACAARVAAMIGRFSELARTAAAALPAVKAITESITQVMERLQGSRLAIAGMNSVPNLPNITRIAKTSELAATQRLCAESDLRRLMMLRKSDGGISGGMSRKGQIAAYFHRTTQEVEDAIHIVKQEAHAGNTDVILDESGEVYLRGRDGWAGESLGNILDHLP